MKPIPYVFFHGNCREAVEAYGQIFGSAPQIMTLGDMPPEAREGMPDVPTDAVMHAIVRVGNGMIYASDDPSEDAPQMAGCSIALELEGEAETRRVWDALVEGGEVRMPLAPTFWTPLFGTLSDRFGKRWMIMTASGNGGA